MELVLVAGWWCCGCAGDRVLLVVQLVVAHDFCPKKKSRESISGQVRDLVAVVLSLEQLFVVYILLLKKNRESRLQGRWVVLEPLCY